MEYRRLGGSGLLVSALGLGTNRFGGSIDAAATRLVIDQALDLGVTLIDTADVYTGGESERLIGQVLAGRRQRVVLATKAGAAISPEPGRSGTSRRWLLEAVEDSLRRLGTDYIDLLQIHFPDPKTPIEETLRALDDLVTQGKVRYIGHSNFAAWQIADAQWTARAGHLTPPVSAQHHYNLLERRIQDEVLPAIRHFGLGLIPYFPLALGFLTGKYHPGSLPEGVRLASSPGHAARLLTPANFERLNTLNAFAQERNRTLLELAMSWLLSQDVVSSVISGASTPDQVKQNAEAALWQLTPAEMKLLTAI